MRHLLALLFASLVTVSLATAPAADAQVCGYCCDVGGNPRCSINQTPCGNPCVCFGQGSGWAC